MKTKIFIYIILSLFIISILSINVYASYSYCNETDSGGKDYTNPGTIFYSYVSIPLPNEMMNESDFCEGNDLIEYSCNQTDANVWETVSRQISCTDYGYEKCTNGACQNYIADLIYQKDPSDPGNHNWTQGLAGNNTMIIFSLYANNSDFSPYQFTFATSGTGNERETIENADFYIKRENSDWQMFDTFPIADNSDIYLDLNNEILSKGKTILIKVVYEMKTNTHSGESYTLSLKEILAKALPSNYISNYTHDYQDSRNTNTVTILGNLSPGGNPSSGQGNSNGGSGGNANTGSGNSNRSITNNTIVKNETKNITQVSSSKEINKDDKKDKTNWWFWLFLLLILLIIAYFVYKHYKKKKRV